MVLDDTHPAVRQRQLECLRSMTTAARHAITEDLTATAVQLSRDAIAARMPGATSGKVMLRWIELVYGQDLARRVAPLVDRLGIAADADAGTATAS